MAKGWSVVDALNKSAKAAADEGVSARFRTRDIDIGKIYRNEGNFYTIGNIEELAANILSVGLMENLTVVYAPSDQGEYKLIAGERRWNALKLLVSQGHEMFRLVTCKIEQPKSESEERVILISANDYRDKSIADKLREVKELKAAIETMKANGETLNGQDLSKGRLRTVIAQRLKTSETKIAQIETINNNLIEEFKAEAKEDRLTFSALLELSGMDEERQREMYERYKETGSLTWRDVKDEKEKAQAAAEEEDPQIPGQMTTDDFGLTDSEVNQDDEEADPHPETIDSLCYSCHYYETCAERTHNVTSCDKYWNRTEANKTDEDRYNEEQDAIDRETQKKLREMEKDAAEDAQAAAGDDQKPSGSMRTIRVTVDTLNQCESGERPYLIVKSDPKRAFKSGEIVSIMAFSNGFFTGLSFDTIVKCVDSEDTSSGVSEGYEIVGIASKEQMDAKKAAAAEESTEGE